MKLTRLVLLFAMAGYLGCSSPDDSAVRLVDVFELDSAPGRGTRVTITKWA